jgi:hypothetical protein
VCTFCEVGRPGRAGGLVAWACVVKAAQPRLLSLRRVRQAESGPPGRVALPRRPGNRHLGPWPRARRGGPGHAASLSGPVPQGRRIRRDRTVTVGRMRSRSGRWRAGRLTVTVRFTVT